MYFNPQTPVVNHIVIVEYYNCTLLLCFCMSDLIGISKIVYIQLFFRENEVSFVYRDKRLPHSSDRRGLCSMKLAIEMLQKFFHVFEN